MKFLADFFLGIAGIDICRDDFGRSRALRLSRMDRNLLRDLAKVRYAEARRTGRLVGVAAKPTALLDSQTADARNTDTGD